MILYTDYSIVDSMEKQKRLFYWTTVENWREAESTQNIKATGNDVITNGHARSM